VDPRGRPVADAAIALVQFGISGVPSLRSHTDANGEFRLSAPPGTYALTATHANWAAAYLPKLEIRECTSIIPVVNLQAGGYLLEGRVVLGRGVEAGRVRLALGRISSDLGDIFLVDLQGGAFKVRLPQGSYIVIAEGAAIRSVNRVAVGPDSKPATIALDPPPRPAPRVVRSWIKGHAIPLDTVEAGHGFADMAPLAKVVGKARVVSLGEATHGTREFFQMKHRMVEYLVREHGFTAFAIEANLPECKALNDYVLDGTGDPRKGLDGIYFWTWNTEEVLALVEWIRAWNADSSHSRKVRFYGFDNQVATEAYAFVKARLAQEDPDLAAWMEERLSDLAKPSNAKPEVAKLKDLRAAAAELGRRLDAKPAFDPFLRRCARLLEQKLDIDLDPEGPARDVGMAENVQWILQQEGPRGRVALWAHNAHVQTGTDLLGQLWMGGHLRQALGSDMVALGFAFREGSFQAIDAGEGALREFTVRAFPSATLDAALDAAGASVLALDLRSLPPRGPVRRWFESSQGTFETGAVFREDGAAHAIAATHVLASYDGLLFVAHTTSARPNHPRRGPRRRSDVVWSEAPSNLGFEEGPRDPPLKAWFFNGAAGYRVSVQTDGAQEGHSWMQMKAKGETDASAWGSVVQSFDARAYRGKRVRLTGWTKATEGAKATFWLRVDRAGPGQGFFDNGLSRAATGDAWTRIVIEGPVAEDADTVTVGAMCSGAGSGGFDGVTLDVVN
jgi:erythromycin esterase